MRTALDTNVLSRLLSGTRDAPLISASLEEAKRKGTIFISVVVRAELRAYPRITDDLLSLFLADTGVDVDLQIAETVWLETGRRFSLYADRRRAAINEGPRRLLADFIIGAHALMHADRLMTFDTALYRRNFPELPLLTPAIE